MPIIVPIEENKVGLATATDAKFRAPDTSGSGLEALGAGLTQLGGGAQQLARGIEERRRRAAEAIAAAMLDDRHRSNIDDAAVKNAYVDYSDGSHEALHGDDGLFNRRGAEAHAAFPGLVEKLVDNHDQALSKLDDVQRAAVAPAMSERLRSDVGRAADFVRQQGAAEQKWQSEQLQRAAARDAANHADDPDLFDHHLATGEKTIRQQAKIDNVGDKLLARQIADYRSGVHADTIHALAQRDPVHAAGWYVRYGDNLNPRDKMRVEAALDPALSEARAVADVDAAGSAGDPTVAPANPHAGNDATLLLKMQGITPMMDRTALPALMQRYGNDPAKAWAAFEAGPETIDRLIAQRGDDWYAGLGEDTRRFVGGNMSMLGVVSSPRDLPQDAAEAAAKIDAQDWDTSRTTSALDELDRRLSGGGVADPDGIIAPVIGQRPTYTKAAFTLLYPGAEIDTSGEDQTHERTLDDIMQEVAREKSGISANGARGAGAPPAGVTAPASPSVTLQRSWPIAGYWGRKAGETPRGGDRDDHGVRYSDGSFHLRPPFPRGKVHKGDDLPGPVGIPVHAAADGIVTAVLTEPKRAQVLARDKNGKLLLRKGKPYLVKKVVPGMGGYGHYIKIRHADGYTTLYGHLQDVPPLKPGMRVNMGQQIGILGKTGNAAKMGSHVHFEVQDKLGRPIDPSLWISGHAPTQR